MLLPFIKIAESAQWTMAVVLSNSLLCCAPGPEMPSFIASWSQARLWAITRKMNDALDKAFFAFCVFISTIADTGHMRDHLNVRMSLFLTRLQEQS